MTEPTPEASTKAAQVKMFAEALISDAEGLDAARAARDVEVQKIHEQIAKLEQRAAGLAEGLDIRTGSVKAVQDKAESRASNLRSMGVGFADLFPLLALARASGEITGDRFKSVYTEATRLASIKRGDKLVYVDELRNPRACTAETGIQEAGMSFAITVKRLETGAKLTLNGDMNSLVRLNRHGNYVSSLGLYVGVEGIARAAHVEIAGGIYRGATWVVAANEHGLNIEDLVPDPSLIADVKEAVIGIIRNPTIGDERSIDAIRAAFILDTGDQPNVAAKLRDILIDGLKDTWARSSTSLRESLEEKLFKKMTAILAGANGGRSVSSTLVYTEVRKIVEALPRRPVI